MKTTLLLNDMSGTNLESMLDEIIMDRQEDPNLQRVDMVAFETIHDLVFNQDRAIKVGDALELDWGSLPASDVTNTQYSPTEEFDNDVEVILRHTDSGSKTVVEIVTFKTEDNYDDAIVSIWYNGSSDDLQKELDVMGITSSDIASVVVNGTEL